MNARSMPLAEVTFPSGEERPALGLGTWRLGEDGTRRVAEVRALRLALDIGYRVLDTAEMYGDGGAETVLGLALAEALRDGVVRDDLLDYAFEIAWFDRHLARMLDVLEAAGELDQTLIVVTSA